MVLSNMLFPHRIWSPLLCGLLLKIAHPALSAPRPAEEMLASIRAQAKNLLEAEDNFTGEVACWQANYNAERFLKAYRETKDPSYVAAAVEYFDGLLARLHTSPDGSRGWVGPYVYDKEYSTDVHISDAILAIHMLELAEVILAEDALAEYAQAARQYVDFAKRDVIGKWVARGTWHINGPYGYFQTWPFMFRGRDLSERVETKTQHDRLALQFNKQTEMAMVALLLYRIEGDEGMRDIAARIARLIKSRLTLHDGHYSWSYWEPLSKDDLWSVEEGKLSHWVGAHPHRHYQILELKFYVAAFRSGIVFDAEDMRRFARTHDAVMWNGDFEDPEWRNSDAGVIEFVTGTYKAPEVPVGRESFMAGRTWPPLAPFSASIRRLTGEDAEAPDDFSRLPSAAVEVFPFVAPSSPQFKMAAAVPASIAQGEDLFAVTSAREGGRFQLDLYDAAGWQKVRLLYEGHFQPTGNHIQPVSTSDLTPGTYRLRWTKGDECRDAIFWITEPSNSPSP